MASESDFGPLSAACVRALSDKAYEKRRVAGQEVEEVSREFANVQDYNQIKRLLNILINDMCKSPNSNLRKGGLTGLASASIGLGTVEIHQFSEEMIRPVLTCLDDSDSRVRFYALEALFNVVKVSRFSIMPIFNDIFTAFASVVTDLDTTTKIGVENLNRLLKDICLDSKAFLIPEFVEVLMKRIYTDDPFSRTFHLGWIEAIHSIPNANIISHLPRFLDAMFVMLGDNHQDIYNKTEAVLGELLTTIKSKPEGCDFKSMTNILLLQSESKVCRIKVMAIFWLREFVDLSKTTMLPFASGLVTVTLPYVVLCEEDKKTMNVEEAKEITILSRNVNVGLMKLLENQKSSTEGEITEKEDLKLEPLVKTLIEFLEKGNIVTKPAVLKWFHHLFKNRSEEMKDFVDEVFPVLLETLSVYSDQVVILDLNVLAEICNQFLKLNDREYFSACIKYLLVLFRKDKKLLDNKGYYIVRQLSLLLSPEDIFRTIAEFIRADENIEHLGHYRHLMEMLSTVLLTAPELARVRQKLIELESKENCELFETLYKCWCHNPTATMALCFHSRCFKHVQDLVLELSKQPLTVELLVDLETLLQMVNSPVFGDIRMQLMNEGGNAELLKAIRSLMLILPISRGFRSMNEMLGSVQKSHENTSSAPIPVRPQEPPKHLDFDELMSHYKRLLELHFKDTEGDRIEFLRAKGIRIVDRNTKFPNFTDDESVDF